MFSQTSVCPRGWGVRWDCLGNIKCVKGQVTCQVMPPPGEAREGTPLTSDLISPLPVTFLSNQWRPVQTFSFGKLSGATSGDGYLNRSPAVHIILSCARVFSFFVWGRGLQFCCCKYERVQLLKEPLRKLCYFMEILKNNVVHAF